MSPDRTPRRRFRRAQRLDRSIPPGRRTETLRARSCGVNMQFGASFLALLVLPVVLLHDLVLSPVVAGVLAGPAAACRIHLRIHRR